MQRLGFGGAPLGNLFAPIAESAATDLVARAWAHGVRYFDTAPHYGNGLSEHRIGAALRDMPRENFILSSKVGRLLTPDALAARSQNGFIDALPFTQRGVEGVVPTLRERQGVDEPVL